MSDIQADIDAMRREVGSRTIEAGLARTVVLSRVYDSTVDDLWDACTNPERIPRWFLPISGDVKLGGRYQLEGHAGGTIETCDPPKSFSATWEFGGGVSWIEVRFSAEPDGGARFELEHITGVADEMWAQFGPGAVGIGWDLLLRGLALHFASGGAQVDPAAYAAWTASDEGKRFVVETSHRWRDASVAAGTDPAGAEAAEERVTTAYTSAPDQPDRD